MARRRRVHAAGLTRGRRVEVRGAEDGEPSTGLVETLTFSLALNSAAHASSRRRHHSQLEDGRPQRARSPIAGSNSASNKSSRQHGRHRVTTNSVLWRNDIAAERRAQQVRLDARRRIRADGIGRALQWVLEMWGERARLGTSAPLAGGRRRRATTQVVLGARSTGQTCWRRAHRPTTLTFRSSPARSAPTSTTSRRIGSRPATLARTGRRHFAPRDLRLRQELLRRHVRARRRRFLRVGVDRREGGGRAHLELRRLRRLQRVALDAAAHVLHGRDRDEGHAEGRRRRRRCARTFLAAARRGTATSRGGSRGSSSGRT